MGNPFSLNFGQPPIQSIDRPVQREEILSAFLSDPEFFRFFALNENAQV